MKIVSIILGIAFVIIAGVMLSLYKKGGALKPAGVIKPSEVPADRKVGRYVANRLFPDFQESKFVIIRVEDGNEELAEIARDIFAHYRSAKPHTLVDLFKSGDQSCEENCWYITKETQALPEAIALRIFQQPTAEIYIQHFNRDETVPEVCDGEKDLDVACMRSVSVREVRRKIKTAAPHFFMQRYQRSLFFLYLENVH